MSNEKCNVKPGMKGSSAGRGRWDKTKVLKDSSKHLRRKQDKERINEQMKVEDMTAVEVPDGTWFMIIRTNTWYKKVSGGTEFVSAEQIPTGKVTLVSNEEEVIEG